MKRDLNKITLWLLLAVECSLAPTSLQAQSGNPSRPYGVAAGAEAISAAPTDSGRAKDRTSDEESRWFVRIGVLGAIYNSSATFAPNGRVLPGATAIISNNVTVMFDVGYDLTKKISVSLMGGVPPKPIIIGKGTVASLGELGKVRYGSAIFTGYYRLPRWGAFRPYVGGGAAYAIILKEHDRAVSQLKVHNNWGSVLQAGGEYELGRKWGLFLDLKEIWLAVNANGLLSGGVPVTARVKLNPSLFSVGIKYHFR